MLKFLNALVSYILHGFVNLVILGQVFPPSVLADAHSESRKRKVSDENCVALSLAIRDGE